MSGSKLLDKNSRIYVGNLPLEISEKDLYRVYNNYGKIKNIDLKIKETGYAFIDYELKKDAEKAIKRTNGAAVFTSAKLIVEFCLRDVCHYCFKTGHTKRFCPEIGKK